MESDVSVTLAKLTRGVGRDWSDFAPMRVTFDGTPVGTVDPETGHWCRDGVPPSLFAEWRARALSAASPYSWRWVELDKRGAPLGEYVVAPTRDEAYEAIGSRAWEGMLARTRNGVTQYKWGVQGDVWAASETAAVQLHDTTRAGSGAQIPPTVVMTRWCLPYLR